MLFSNEQLLQRVTSDFLQRATSATGNEKIFQQATSILQWATSNDWFSTSNEQRVKSYALHFTRLKLQIENKLNVKRKLVCF